jgi:hypothetical protein
MNIDELRDALDAVILSSGVPAEDVVGVLEQMLYSYTDQAAQDLDERDNRG